MTIDLDHITVTMAACFQQLNLVIETPMKVELSNDSIQPENETIRLANG